MNTADLIKQERESESICDYCGLRMVLVKGKNRNHYDKPHDKYVCSCGNEFRVRSLNEVLRDLDLREDE